MSPFHAALASTLLGLGVGMTMIGRAWPTGGRHRRRRVEVLSEELLDDLLGPRPEPVYGTPIEQAWRWCPSCSRNEPSVLHNDGGWTCGHCFETTINTTTGSAL